MFLFCIPLIVTGLRLLACLNHLRYALTAFRVTFQFWERVVFTGNYLSFLNLHKNLSKLSARFRTCAVIKGFLGILTSFLLRFYSFCRYVRTGWNGMRCALGWIRVDFCNGFFRLCCCNVIGPFSKMQKIHERCISKLSISSCLLCWGLVKG